ncbi:MAG TPA: hypothetical protein VG145_00005, partial [Xanthobacteraceae bacterium]|nr:hypothetical protein [Xanthobacteraceae bacterium]
CTVFGSSQLQLLLLLGGRYNTCKTSGRGLQLTWQGVPLWSDAIVRYRVAAIGPAAASRCGNV